MNRFQIFLLHVCVVCSLVCMAAKLLDWYNPYMDFSGHIMGVQFLLYGCIFLQVICNEIMFAASNHRKRKQQKGRR